MKKSKKEKAIKVICIKECHIQASYVHHNCKIGEIFLNYEDEFYFNEKLVGIWNCIGIEEYFLPIAEYRDKQIDSILND